MTAKVLTKTANIELCHALLKERLRYDNYQTYHVRVQYRTAESEGKEEYTDVVWLEPYGFWADLSDPWRPNMLGLSKESLIRGELLTITCRFDFQPGKSGVFCRDQYGGILLAHNGDILGGGGESLKTAFWQDYKGPRLENAEQLEQPFAVVAHLGSVDIARQIKDFLNEVVRIKTLAWLFE
ncbi:MAG: hypothetical protein U1F76_30115 [Candidatus Competibacteraceae bacterium]